MREGGFSGVIAEIAEHPFVEFVSNEGLLRLINKAAECGKTEITAALLQKLHERRNSHEKE